MSTELLPPQLVINQKFAIRPAGTQYNTRVVLFGSMAHLVRYSVGSERAQGLLGVYERNPGVVSGRTQRLYGWPNNPTGNTVDLEFVELHVRDGLFRYFEDADTNQTLQAQRNLIRLPTQVVGSNLYGLSDVLDGGAVAGDVVKVTGTYTVGGGPYTLWTYLLGLKGEPVAATVAIPESATSNYSQVGAFTPQVTFVGVEDKFTFGTSGTYADPGYAHVTETYVLTVIEAGEIGVARVSIKSASGTDDVENRLVEANTLVGDRGITLTVANEVGGPYSFALGEQITIVVRQTVAGRTITVSGTYVGKQDRNYIIEAVAGGARDGGMAKIRISSQDGSDTSIPQLAGPSFSLGSYGLQAAFGPGQTLVKGDKWLVRVVAATEGIQRTVVLAHEVETGVADTVKVELFRRITTQIPRQSFEIGQFNYWSEETQIGVAGSINLRLSDFSLDGDPVDLQLWAGDPLGQDSSLYCTYRSWYPASSDIQAISSRTDLNTALLGPLDPDNPLKYGVSLTRNTALGETIYVYNVGDPTDEDNWQRGFDIANRSRAVYSYVPLTVDHDVLVLANAAVQTANSNNYNAFRVLWVGSRHYSTLMILDQVTTTNTQNALAVCEDDVLASGTQYTQIRLTSNNANLQTLGIRVGDVVRYQFSVDDWGVETCQERIVTSVRSATTLVVDQPFDQEAIPLRVEIQRTLNATELRNIYGQASSSWGSDLVRYVLAPRVLVGSRELPGYYGAAMAAGLRSSMLPHAPLSTHTVPGIANVLGYELFSDSDLNILAGQGCMILYYDHYKGSVRVRHGVTTGDTDVLAHREESMVTARHVALFTFHSRLEGYAGRINISDGGDEFQVLSEQIRSELESAGNELRTMGFTPELGGVIRSLTIESIEQSDLQADELIINGTLELGRPGNKITFNVLIR